MSKDLEEKGGFILGQKYMFGQNKTLEKIQKSVKIYEVSWPGQNSFH